MARGARKRNAVPTDCHRWLVTGPTFVVACHARSASEAQALVIDAVGGRSRGRAELADNLDVKQACNDARWNLVVNCRRPLHVTTGNRIRVDRLLVAIEARDAQSDRLSEGGDRAPGRVATVPRKTSRAMANAKSSAGHSDRL